MAKRQAKVEGARPEETSARVERDLVEKAKLIAAARNQSICEVLSRSMRVTLEAEYRDMVRRLAQGSE